MLYLYLMYMQTRIIFQLRKGCLQNYMWWEMSNFHHVKILNKSKELGFNLATHIYVSLCVSALFSLFHFCVAHCKINSMNIYILITFRFCGFYSDKESL